jgi:hypothetical protein
MFEPPDATDGATLRQGDIIADVQILGALNYRGIQFVIPSTGGDPTGWSVAARPTVGHVIVLSHSCEVARENAVKLTSVILAPLRDLSTATKPDRVQELIDSNFIDQTQPAASYLKYFYIEPNELLPFGRGAVADFSKLFSVRKNAYDYLLGKKVLQLTKAAQGSMALKLALYFHRTEEETAA